MSTLSEFERGYLIACANVVNLHRDDVTAADVAMELGVTWQQIAKADFCETDIAALKKIRTARHGVFRENRT